ncbi:MAG: redox-regulated ATPase YchF [Nitrospirae bacterium]|nr:redox-regulated ATPase YchF [Nitrospirota bacterium]
MSFTCGLVGLPNAGKSTLFNALTGGGAETAPRPFSTLEPKKGVVSLPDPRLVSLGREVGADRIVPASLEVTDVAGLVKGASEGEGLGNQFLGHLRPLDAIVHVVRLFESDKVGHVYGTVDPVRDLEIVELELSLADLDVLDRRIEKIEKPAQMRVKEAEREFLALSPIRDALRAGTRAPTEAVATDVVRGMGLLCLKRRVAVANTAEETSENALAAPLRSWSDGQAVPLVAVAARLEEELRELPEDERGAFLAEYFPRGLGTARLVRALFRTLDLITFYTIDGGETRAWPVPRGTKVAEAGGRIHTDFERKFIRAEVATAAVMLECGGWPEATKRGSARTEGREYVVQDGDVIHLRTGN